MFLSEEALPSHVQLFLDRYILSIEQLEILLLLFSKRSEFLTLQAICNSLRNNPNSANRLLQNLVAVGLVEIDVSGDGFRLESRDEIVLKTIEDLAGYYKTHRIRVINSIVSSSKHVLLDFANAFKIRRGDPPHG